VHAKPQIFYHNQEAKMNAIIRVLFAGLIFQAIHGASGDRSTVGLSQEPVQMTAVPTAIAGYVLSSESERNRFLVKLLKDLCEAQAAVRVGGLVECAERRQFLNIIQTLTDTAQIQLTESAELRVQVARLELKNARLDLRLHALQELNRRLLRSQMSEEDAVEIRSDLVSPVQTIDAARGYEPLDDGH